MAQILLIEDDTSTCFLVRKILEKEHTIISCGTLQEGQDLIKSNRYDLILLDVELPDGDGFEFLSASKSMALLKNVPIVLITGRSNEADQILGYSLGAEDYIVKPVYPLLLVARVNAKLKKYEQHTEIRDVLNLGNIKVVLSKQKLFLVRKNRDEEIYLTTIEYKLLLYFLQHEDQVLSRNQIMANVWGDNVHVFDRTVDTHICHLRNKLKGASHTVNSVHGSGYRIASPAKWQKRPKTGTQ